jgi:heptosyltransferase III
VLVLRPGALGDTLLAVPALRLLRARFGPLTLAAHGGASRFLADVGEVDQALAFDDNRLAWLFRSDATQPCQDVVAWLDPKLVPGLRSAVLVAPSRPTNEVHVAQYLVDTLGLAGEVNFGPLQVEPLRSDEVLVHPGSGSGAKNWPAERFAALALLVPDVRMIVGEADALVAEAMERAYGRPLPRLERPRLGELAARLAGCRGYVGNDSGVSHLAGLCGARTLALFGPTSPSVWHPLGPRVSVYGFDVTPEQLALAL